MGKFEPSPLSRLQTIPQDGPDLSSLRNFTTDFQEQSWLSYFSLPFKLCSLTLHVLTANLISEIMKQ